MTLIARKTRFFPGDDQTEAFAFAEALKAYGHKDVLVSHKKNADDLARFGGAMARIEGTNVGWTPIGPRYNHMLTIAFIVVNDDPIGDQFTIGELHRGLMKRVADLQRSPERKEWIEACGAAENTYEVDDPGRNY